MKPATQAIRQLIAVAGGQPDGDLMRQLSGHADGGQWTDATPPDGPRSARVAWALAHTIYHDNAPRGLVTAALEPDTGRAVAHVAARTPDDALAVDDPGELARYVAIASRDLANATLAHPAATDVIRYRDDCPRCDATGTVDNFPRIPPGHPRYAAPDRADVCSFCDGEGADRHGGDCRDCHATGEARRIRVDAPCRRCGGTGTEATYEPGRHRLPAGVSLCDSMPVGYARRWAAALDVAVHYTDGRLTRAAALIGVAGACWTSVDYGDAHRHRNPSALAAAVRGQLADRGAQWTKVTDDGRTVADTVAVVVGTTGYYVADARRVDLPTGPLTVHRGERGQPTEPSAV